jgi:hypothetical protein
MGNSSSNPPPEGEEILIHSFLLDADFDTCQVPLICPRKNAMFHPPTGLNDNVQHFLSLAEAQTIVADLNKILHNTAFNPRVSNPCFLLAVLISFGSSGIFTSSMTSGINLAGNEEIETNWRGNEETENSRSQDDSSSSIGVSIGGLVLGLMLPYLCFFILVAITKSCRKRQLTNYVAEWNSRTRGNGVALSFGGGGTTPRGVTVGSEFGGTYHNFYMAMWDPKGLMFRGYLHVFVHTGVRQRCANGTYYVAPVPLGQAAPVQVVTYQPPPGYALVPMSELQASGNPPTAPPSYEKAVA